MHGSGLERPQLNADLCRHVIHSAVTNMHCLLDCAHVSKAGATRINLLSSSVSCKLEELVPEHKQVTVDVSYNYRTVNKISNLPDTSNIALVNTHWTERWPQSL